MVVVASGLLLGTAPSAFAAQCAAGTCEIMNTATSANGGIPSWLEHNGMSGGGYDDSHHAAVTVVVRHPASTRVNRLRIDQKWQDAGDNSDDAGSSSAGSEVFTPTVTPETLENSAVGGGGFTYSRVSYTWAIRTADTGLGQRSNKVLHLRAQLENGDWTPAVSATMYFVRGHSNDTGDEDYPYLWNRSQSPGAPARIGVGSAVTFTFQGDERDSGSNWNGYQWRKRRLSDGVVEAGGDVCFSGGDSDDNRTVSVNPTFNRRGRWVVEARLSEGEDTPCNFGYNTNNGGNVWFRIGSVDVNSAQSSTSPAVSVAVDARLKFNSANAGVAEATVGDPDSGNGGAVQLLEWDKDGNASNGVNGFETNVLGALTGLTAGQKETTISTVGMDPGTLGIRARATDNGAMSAADTIRRRTTSATANTLINTPPAVAAQTVDTDAGVDVPITLGGTDANGDDLTYTTSNPANGTLTGSGGPRTYTPNPGFVGTDTFTVTADDSWNTGSGTVTVRVHPTSTLTSGPAEDDRTGSTVSFDFTSQGGTTFECSLNGATYSACTTPAELTGLASGENTFSVRAVAGSLIERAPVTRTWTVDADAPAIEVTSGPGATPFATQTSRTAAFALTATGDDLQTVECRIDAGNWSDCAAGSASYSDLHTASHVFEARVVDDLGNEATAERRFVVDPANRQCTLTSVSPSPIIGTPERDVICVGLGDYAIEAGGGKDVVFAGPGNDDLGGGDEDDELFGGGGADDLSGGQGHDRLDGGPGADGLHGDDGIDRVLYDSRTAGVTVTIGTGTGDDGETGEGDTVHDDVESLTGTEFGDQITGSAFSNTFSGRAGTDVLDGAQGDDFLGGGTGAHEFIGGDGIDRVSYASSTAAVNVTLDDAANDGAGGEGDNVRSDVEYLYGGRGADVFDASARTSGGVGLWGNEGADTLIGTADSDYLFGGLGEDVLDGRDGNDIVSGGRNADDLTCGIGTDQFVVDPLDTFSGTPNTAGYEYGDCEDQVVDPSAP